MFTAACLVASHAGPSWELVNPQGTLSSPYMPCKVVMPYFSSYQWSLGSIWQSLPFYTSEGGYRMCLVISASGKGGDNNLGVFMSLMEGENDDQLQWPFEGVVTISMLNWVSNSRHVLKCLDYEYVPAKCKERVFGHKRGSECGISHFHPLSCLKYNPEDGTEYLRNDSVCFALFC